MKVIFLISHSHKQLRCQRPAQLKQSLPGNEAACNIPSSIVWEAPAGYEELAGELKLSRNGRNVLNE